MLTTEDINSEDESTFISLLLSGFSSAWIGGHDLLFHKDWQWSDNTVWSYTDWASGYPKDNVGYDCLLFEPSQSTGKIKNWSCKYPYYYMYVCEIPQGVVQSSEEKDTHSVAQSRDGFVLDLLRGLMKQTSVSEK